MTSGTGREAAYSEEADGLEEQMWEAGQEDQDISEEGQEKQEIREAGQEDQEIWEEGQEIREEGQEEQELRDEGQEEQEIREEGQETREEGQEEQELREEGQEEQEIREERQEMGQEKQQEGQQDGLPPGYSLLLADGNGRRILTPPTEANPKGLRIRRVGELTVLHSKGRCLDLKLGHLNLLKTRASVIRYSCLVSYQYL